METRRDLSVQSELIPLYNRTGFLLKMTLENQTEKSMKVRLLPEVNLGNLSVNPLNKWTFGQPPKGNDAKYEGDNHLFNETVYIDLFEESQDKEIPANKSCVNSINKCN